MPHTPLRRCRVCRKQLPKAQLRRWTVSDGVLTQDPSQTASGRGYYSCSDKCSDILPKTIKFKLRP
jgi:predicted RNA-binding protein YlxR (DUF448 family)